ncbi:MAG: phosphocholine cytidylyltransferase family protein [Pseudomonadota bacterium]|nr:phosphocholine cytidylyltransferase family protein [Pseudomonadota bacterium]
MNLAVILAAGMGTRLQGEHPGKPKGLLEIGGRSIIETSILNLRQAGIRKIIIVTGFGSDQYSWLEIQYDGLVQLIYNPEFSSSGSMYSLYCARTAIDEDFLLLESDLIYDARAIDILIEDQSDDAILLSGPTRAGDEVYVAASDGLLTGMSKDESSLLCSPSGELVGISKISQGLFNLMKTLSGNVFESSLQYDYETDCLVAAARTHEISCLLVEDLDWAEIDDAEHLRRAREEVWPRIQLSR